MVAFSTKSLEDKLDAHQRWAEKRARTILLCAALFIAFLGGAVLAFTYWQGKGLGCYLLAVGGIAFVLVAILGGEEGGSDGR